MLILHRSNVVRTKMVPVLTSEVGQIVEGMALRNDVTTGVARAARSDATTTQAFLGVAAGPVRGVFNTIKTASVTPTAGNLTISLGRLVIGADITVETVTGTRLTVVTGAPASGEVQYTTVSGATSLTFNAAQAGTTYYCIFSTAATATDVITSWPGHPGTSGQPAEDVQATVPVIMQGTIATDYFVAAEDWTVTATSPQLKIGATGIFLPGPSATAGTNLTNVSIVKVPTYSDPVLIFDIH